MMQEPFSKRFKQIIEKQKPPEIVHVLLQIKIALGTQTSFPKYSDPSKIKLELKSSIHRFSKTHHLDTHFFDELDSNIIFLLVDLALSTENLAVELRHFMNSNPRRTGVNFTPIVIRQLMQNILIRISQNKNLIRLCDPAARTGDMVLSSPMLSFSEVYIHSDRPFEHAIALLFSEVMMLEFEGLKEDFLKKRISVQPDNPLHDVNLFNRMNCDAIISAIALNKNFDSEAVQTSDKDSDSKTISTRWVEHVIESLSKEGIAVLLLEDGFFHRQTYDYQIRETLIEQDFVEMVITLPANLYLKNAHFNASILVINKNKSPENKNTVNFINVQKLKELSSSQIETLAQLIYQPENENREHSNDVDDLSFEAISTSTQEIKHNAYTLRPLDYLPAKEAKLLSNFNEELTKLNCIQDEWLSLKNTFIQTLEITKS